MSDDLVLDVKALGFPWDTIDPFLFCVHHDDAYPAGNERLGPAVSLAGRHLGQDFAGLDGFRMYHGTEVPGFPAHPHRGFETVTIVRRGLIDHSDSLGAAARFGGGDTQWLTTGRGVVHSEMFPLLRRDAGNPLELFQIWLNLPAEDKMVDPHFAMLWNERIPRRTFLDREGRATEVAIVAGAIDDARAPAPPPRSWAARPDTDVAIWTIELAPHARWTAPPAIGPSTRRTLYFFEGESLTIGGPLFQSHAAVEVVAGAPVEIVNGERPSELLMLQGRPIGQPVVQYGPFVMSSPEQIQQAMLDYRRTRFGGWPWPSDAPTHPRERGRFARHVDGRVEEMP
ncbi:MAG: pirin family protein [Deltaproteobacteria bacterium]|nr:pirin family protein [Deltaproteobacteria bacterium]